MFSTSRVPAKSYRRAYDKFDCPLINFFELSAAVIEINFVEILPTQTKQRTQVTSSGWYHCVHANVNKINYILL